MIVCCCALDENGGERMSRGQRAHNIRGKGQAPASQGLVVVSPFLQSQPTPEPEGSLMILQTKVCVPFPQVAEHLPWGTHSVSHLSTVVRKGGGGRVV